MTPKELETKYESKAFGLVNVRRDWKCLDCCGAFPATHYMPDNNQHIEDKGWSIYLNHSCDEWIIGIGINSIEDAKSMIGNISSAVKYCEDNP